MEDFDQQLLGMRPKTTKEFLMHFPDHYFNKDLSGLDITFTVMLKEIREELLPEIDDEFAKSLGKHETITELKQAIRKELERSYEARSEQELRHDIINKLLEQATIELPEVLINHELSAVVNEAKEAVSHRGLSLEETGQTEETLSENYRPLAERRVREYLLLEKVIDQEGLTATDEILEQAYNEMAENMHQPVNTIKQFHENNKEAYEVFKQRVLEKEAIKSIIASSTLETIEK